MRKIWITWEQHRRTRELVSELADVKLVELKFESNRLARYSILLLQTILVLVRERPHMVIVQSPSNFLALFMVTVGRLLTSCVVVDAHNGAVRPFYSKYDWLLPFFRFIHRHAEITIATNQVLANQIFKNGGNPFILEDKIPNFSKFKQIPLKGQKNAVFICTFEKDEPFYEVIQAAKSIDSSICLYVTGKYQKVQQAFIDHAPSNVVFTGFLAEEDYVNLLYSCNAIIDLTLLSDCLVCGAYEAVSLGKPVILSDTPVLRNYFYRGAVFSENKPEAIAKSILYTLENEEKLKNEVKNLRTQLQKEWNKKLRNLIGIMDQMACTK